MIPTFDIDDYDLTRPLGLPIDAYVHGVLWLPATSVPLNVPHELLVGDVANWLASEADWRAAGPYAADLASAAADFKLNELGSICRTLATLDRHDPDLPLGVRSRVLAGPWLVSDAESAAAYVQALQDASRRGTAYIHEETSWLLDARAPILRLYLGTLLHAHGSYTGPHLRASAVSHECLQAMVSLRRVAEEG